MCIMLHIRAAFPFTSPRRSTINSVPEDRLLVQGAHPVPLMDSSPVFPFVQVEFPDLFLNISPVFSTVADGYLRDDTTPRGALVTGSKYVFVGIVVILALLLIGCGTTAEASSLQSSKNTSSVTVA